MATLDEIRLQQLLSPVQNLNTGITSTTAATPFINTADILNQYNIPGLQNKNLLNQDLINQIIADNQRKTKMIIEDNKVKTVPISYPNVSAAPLRFATDDQASFFFPTDRRIVDQIVPLKKPTRGIMDSTIASNLLYEDLPSGISTSYGVANEPDVVEDIQEAKKSKSGIGGLLRFLLGLVVPGAGLFTGGLNALRGLNQRIQQSDFGRAKTLADYLDIRKYGGYQEREDARAATMAQARGIQKKIDRGEFNRDTSGITDRGRGSIPSRPTPTQSKSSTQGGMQAERTRSRDLGRMRGGVGR